jgi:hypothetical protein
MAQPSPSIVFGASLCRANAPDARVIACWGRSRCARATRPGSNGSVNTCGRLAGRGADDGAYRNVHQAMLLPSRPDTVFMTTGVGLYRSSDGGDHWERLTGEGHRRFRSSNRGVFAQMSVMRHQNGLADTHDRWIDEIIGGFLKNREVFMRVRSEEAIDSGLGVVVADGNDAPVDPSWLSHVAANVVLVRPETCTKNRSLCEKMGRSMAEANAFLHKHPKQSMAILAKRLNITDQKVLSEAYKSIAEASPSPPVSDAKEFETAETLNVEAGFMKPSEKAKSYRNMFTNAYLSSNRITGK